MRSLKHIKLPVDLNKCPDTTAFEAAIATVSPDEPGKAFGIANGDLHGHTMKLINVLKQSGILAIESEQYDRLKTIFEKAHNATEKYQHYDKYHQVKTKPASPFPTAAEFNEFYTILEQAEWNPRHAMRLMGDTVADAMGNDYLTLLTLKAMQRKGVAYDIMQSNHDYEFIRACESDSIVNSSSSTIRNDQRSSLNRLQQSIRRGDIKEDDVRAFYNEFFKPHLKLTEYDGEMSYMHAPVRFEEVKVLAKKFGVKINNGMSKNKKMEAVKEIDRRFQEWWVMPNTITEYYEGKIREDLPTSEQQAVACVGGDNYEPYRNIIEKNFPLACITWNRTLDPSKNPDGYRQVHGHTGESGVQLSRDAPPGQRLNMEKQYYNVDTYLGKRLGIVSSDKGGMIDLSKGEQPLWLGEHAGVGPVFHPLYPMLNGLKSMPRGIRDIKKLMRRAGGSEASEALLKEIQTVANRRLLKGVSGCCCGLFKPGERELMARKVYECIRDNDSLDAITQALPGIIDPRDKELSALAAGTVSGDEGQPLLRKKLRRTTSL